MVEEILLKTSADMIGGHCVPDSEHIPRTIPALPWNQSDNNNSATFVRLLNTNPMSRGSLGVTRVIPECYICFCHSNYLCITRFGATGNKSFFLALT